MLDKKINQIQLLLDGQKDIALIFPPFYSQQEIIKKITTKLTKKVIVIDCRNLADLSLQRFFETFLYLVSGKIEKEGLNLSFLTTKISQQLEKNYKQTLLVIKNVQYLLPLIDLVLLNLETIAEAQPNLHFLFTATCNFYSERIYRRIKNAPFILNNVFYFSFDNIAFDLRSTEIIWNNLSEIQRRLMRLIITGEKNIESQFTPDLEYLLKVGIIDKKKDFYLNKLENINQLLINGQDQKLTLKNGRIFFGEELVHHKFTAKQVRVLKLFLENNQGLITRDQIVEVLWKGDGEEKYSNWAIDKFIQRLRRRMEENLINSSFIRTVKRKGFVLQIMEKSPTAIEKTLKNGLIFEEFVCDKENIDFHVKGFQDKNLRKILWKTTPKTKREIIDWIKEVTIKPDYRYYSIRKNSRLIGHIALDDIDIQSKSARIGCFLMYPKLWDIHGETIFKFIIEDAKNEVGLGLLYIDVASAEARQVRVVENLGFKKSLTKENILYFNIN